MQKTLSLWAAELAARLPKGWVAVLGTYWPAAVGKRPERAASDLGSEAEEVSTWGCGWFDSSHELVHGLQIEENSAEALSALPLAIWLDLEWRSCPAAAPSA